MLIDYTYFNGQINIPNADSPAVKANLDRFIALKERELLILLLGRTFYAAYEAGITADTQIYKDIRDGKAYGDDGKVWRGLKESVAVGATTYKQSLIANYIWYWWMRNTATTTAGVGESSNTATNGKRTSPAMKMATAWNEAYDWSLELYEFLQDNASTYPLWDGNIYHLGRINPYL